MNRTVRRLRRVIEHSQSIQTAASDAIEALNATIEYRQALEERTVNGTSAWTAASGRSDALQDVFALGLSGTSDVADLRNRLLELRRSAAELEADARRVVTLLERHRGAEINRSALYRRYRAVHAGRGGGPEF